MDCVIKNHKNVYIRLNENGKAVTCIEPDKTLFTELKAKNVLASLPKTLKRLKFKIEFLPDIMPKQAKPPDDNPAGCNAGCNTDCDSSKHDDSISNKPASLQNREPTVIQSDNYVVQEEVRRWIDKFGICDEVLQEARNRREELIIELSNVDKKLSNYIHNVELHKKIDMYSAWLERMAAHDLTTKRRCIKDEILIIENVMRMDFRNFKGEDVKKSVEGLVNRKFTLRVVEDDGSDIGQQV